MAASRDDELEITRVFDAPRDLVFSCWTVPSRMALWHAPEGMEIEADVTDVREGGRYRVKMRSEDGKTYVVHGVYREIVANERLVMTHEWEEEGAPETIVTVTFADDGAKTRVTLRQSGFATKSSRDGHTQGWESTFDRLEHYLRGER
jgi:uncharacterized protein YndB with AHSA1/START domain